MKKFNITTIALALLAALTFFTSCSKDKELDKEMNEIAARGLVGEWNVTEGTANVYEGGYLLANVHMLTSGTITFENDGTGIADFGIQIGSEQSELQGPFTWEDQSFEIIITYPDGSVERWSKVDDDANIKRIQVTQEDEDTPTDETEMLLTLVRS